MSWTVREQIAQAIAEDDRARELCAAHECIEQQEQLEQNLVYKTFDNALRRPAPAQSVDDDAWNLWARAHVEILRSEVEDVVGDIGEAIGKLGKEIKRLDSELASVRADNEILRGVVRGDVATIKRGRDVAA